MRAPACAGARSLQAFSYLLRCDAYTVCRTCAAPQILYPVRSVFLRFRLKKFTGAEIYMNGRIEHAAPAVICPPKTAVRFFQIILRKIPAPIAHIFNAGSTSRRRAILPCCANFSAFLRTTFSEERTYKKTRRRRVFAEIIKSPAIRRQGIFFAVTRVFRAV